MEEACFRACNVCRVFRSHSEFHVQKRGPHRSRDYYNPTCKHCWNRKVRKKDRAKRQHVLSYYGGCCSCCGEDTYEFLALDHINGGGNAHRKQIGVNVKFHMWLLKNGLPEGYRVLCHNCNHSLGSYGHCPHAAEKDPNGLI